MGNPETSEYRLNLSQSFNGVGSFLGPIVGGALFFSDKSDANSSELDSVMYVYIAIAAVVLLVAYFFVRTPMPEVKEDELIVNQHPGRRVALSGRRTTR